jgi:Ribbon-helix-helix protein, copG family
MNFNIYVEDSLAEKLERLSEQQGKKRNAIIREALEAWVARFTPNIWPDIVMNYDGTEDGITFEATRSELLSPEEIEL